MGIPNIQCKLISATLQTLSGPTIWRWVDARGGSRNGRANDDDVAASNW